MSPDGRLHDALEARYVDAGVNVRSGEFNGRATPEAKRAVVRRLETLGRGRGTISYRLRDWVFSRQRYWGEPIPMYFPVELADPTGDPRRGAAHTIRYDQPLAVDESELPLRLPELADTTRARTRRARSRASATGASSSATVAVRAGDQHHAAMGGLVLVLPAVSRPGRQRRALGDGRVRRVDAPIYHMLTRHTKCQDLGHDYYDRRHAERAKHRTLQTLERQGYRVILEPVAMTTAVPSRATFCAPGQLHTGAKSSPAACPPRMQGSAVDPAGARALPSAHHPNATG